jgi:Zn-dependent M16 (insulinase) family peptidase
VLCNDVFANGVNYVEIDIDLDGLPDDLYAYVPHYCDAVNKMGAAGQSYVAVAQRRAALTGGVWCSAPVLRHASHEGRCLRRLRVGLKTLDDQAEDALQLLRDLLFDIDPRDKDRLRDVLTQTQSACRTTLINDGLGTARRHAARGLTPEAALDHLYLSRDALRLVNGIVALFDTAGEDLMQRIARIRSFLQSRVRWTVSFTGSERAHACLAMALRDWSARLRDEPLKAGAPAFSPYATPPRDGLAAPVQISYCAKVMLAPGLTSPDFSPFGLGAYLAQFDFLLPEVRFKGNAYGSGAAHDSQLGVFCLYSYRDPRIVETLAVFDGVGDYVRRADWTQTDIDRAIVGSAKSAERPIRPAEATGAALTRYVRGDTNALREQRYQAALRATPKAVKRAFLTHFDAAEPSSALCVMASREMLEAANRGLGQKALAISDALG